MSTAVSNAGSTPTPGRAATAPLELFARLVDDAAIFPPGNAALPAAVRAHRLLRAGHLAAFVGPLLCTASRLAELRLVLDHEAGDEPPLDVAVVVDTGTGGLASVVATARADDRLDLQAVEIALRGEADVGTTARRATAAVLDADLPDGTAVYVEVPRVPAARDALEVLAEYDLRAKLRTGGADAAAFPDKHEVVTFLDACLDLELILKCTAGLHNAVRHTDPVTGFAHHGFLNVLLATHVLLAGGTAADAEAVLADRDGATLAVRARALSDSDASRVRRTFASYGSCSVTEPIDDLVALGLIDEGLVDLTPAHSPEENA